MLNKFKKGNAALTRIRHFLLREEIDETEIGLGNDPKNAIVFKNVDLGWTEDVNEKLLTG